MYSIYQRISKEDNLVSMTMFFKLHIKNIGTNSTVPIRTQPKYITQVYNIRAQTI